MKYKIETIIDLPRKEVINKLDSVDNLKHWQRGLVGVEHLSGTPGETGAKMKLLYEFGKKKMEMTETITKRELPEAFHATYDADGMMSIQENYFEETPGGQTRWISDSEFIPTGLMMKLMVFLMPGAFKRQSRKYMEDFKNFAEQGISVTDL